MAAKWFVLSGLMALVGLGCSSSDPTTPIVNTSSPPSPEKTNKIVIKPVRVIPGSSDYPEPDNIGDGSCKIDVDYPKLNPLPSHITPKQVLERTLTLLDTIKSDDDLQRENIKKVMQAPDAIESIRYNTYKIEEDITPGDWNYAIVLGMDKYDPKIPLYRSYDYHDSSSHVSISLTNRKSGYSGMEYVCQMDFDQFFSKLINLGYSYQPQRPLEGGNIIETYIGSYGRDAYIFKKNLDESRFVYVRTSYIKYNQCRCIFNIDIFLFHIYKRTNQ